MPINFYAGHSMEWIERFKKAIPNTSKLHLTNAICLAEAIHHQTTFKKRNDIILNRKALRDFGLNYHRVKPYLLCFEKAGLIELTIKRRSPTKVKLILLDSHQYVPKNNEIKDTYNNKSNYVRMNLTQGSNKPSNYARTDLDENNNSENPKEPPKGGKQEEGPRDLGTKKEGSK